MILGITGTNGAGKGAVVEYLVQKHGYLHCSVRLQLIKEIEARGLPVNRTTMNEVATEIREKNGADYFTTFFIEKARSDGVENIVIESIRTVREADTLKAEGGYIVAVDADRKVRFERISARGSHTDQVTFEEFVTQEDREMTSEDPNNPAKMSVFGVMSMADYTIFNEGTFEELAESVDTMLKELSKRAHA